MGRPRLWTREFILDRVRKLHAQGKDIRPVSLRRIDRYLYLRLRQEFGSTWDAFEAAGIDPAALGVVDSRTWSREYSTWSKEDVVEALRKRGSEGKSLLPVRIQAEDVRLYRWMLTLFGSSEKAIEAAGFSATAEGLKKVKWTKPMISDSLKKMKQAGFDIRPRVLCKTAPGLYSAGLRLFGDSTSMYSQAGINIKTLIVAELPGSWTKERVVRDIRGLSKRELNLNRASLDKKYPKLVQAATKLFGSWYTALDAAGIEGSRYRKEKPKGYWTRETILREILMRAAEGHPLAWNDLSKTQTDLLAAAISEFGSWYKALEAAAVRLNPEKARLRVANGHWNAERVVNEIGALVANGEEISSRNCFLKRGKLYTAAVRYHGSWEKAVLAAGIDYDKVRRQHKPYTREDVVKALSELKAQGLSLAYSSMVRFDGGLTVSAAHLFGSYKNAIEALGLDYREIRKDWHTECMKGKILEEYVEEAFQVLGRRLDHGRIFRFSEGSSRPDFYDPTTKEWIDVKLSSWTPEVMITLEKYLRHASSVTILYLHETKRRKKVEFDERVRFTAIKDLYEDLRRANGQSLVDSFEMLRRGIIEPELQTRL